MSVGTRRPVPADLFGGRLADCFLLDLEVVAIADRTPRLRTITFRSPDLVDFTWQAGQDVMFTVPAADPVARRRYTIRRSDPVAGTLDIEVVLHGTGPFAAWAAGTTVGDRIDGIGPRGAITVKDAPHHLFVGDESAIAVTDAMLEALPADRTATAVLGADDPAELTPLGVPASAAAVDVLWLPADEVVEHLRFVALPVGTVAYLNGERALAKQAADVLTARGLPAEAIATKAYWRRDRANAPHGEPPKD